MTLPGFQDFMLPVLRLFGDGEAHNNAEATEFATAQLRLTPEDLAHRIPTGSRTKAADRTLWSLTYLTQAGLLSSVGRGLRKITERGIAVLKKPPVRVDMKFLRQFPEYLQFQARARESSRTSPIASKTAEASEISSPAEVLDEAFREVENPVRADLLASILRNPPEFFERLVLDVLTRVGYGGEVTDGVEHTGKSGDGGVDGVIKEDALGLELIYVQAKRYVPEQTIGRPAIQQFAGTLEGFRAKKGIFITTSSFSTDAKDYARRIDKRLALLDGDDLIDLMLKHGVGCRTVRTYEVKAIDQDYFEP
jgi:restriction system protein